MTDEDLIADEDVVVTISRPRLHQAPAGRHLPPPAPRRQGDHRPRHARGGRGRAPARREHPRLGAVLHEPRPRVLGEGPRDPRRQPPGQGHADHQPAGRPGRVRRGADGHDHAAGLRARRTTSSWRPGEGIIKKTPLEQFERVRSTGIRAITIDDDDELAWVDVSTGRTTSSSPPPRACSPASTRTRSGRWAAMRPASSASACSSRRATASSP